MVNIWQSYKQERGCFMHFACLANTLLKDEESALDNTIQYNTKFVKRHVAVASEALKLLVTLPNIHRFKKNFLTVSEINFS